MYVFAKKHHFDDSSSYSSWLLLLRQKKLILSRANAWCLHASHLEYKPWHEKRQENEKKDVKRRMEKRGKFHEHSIQ